MQKSNKQERGKEEQNYTCKTSTEKAGLEEESSRHARHRSGLLLLPFFSASLWKFLRRYICYCVNEARIRERGRDVACGKGPGQEVDGEDRGFRLSQCSRAPAHVCPRCAVPLILLVTERASPGSSAVSRKALRPLILGNAVKISGPVLHAGKAAGFPGVKGAAGFVSSEVLRLLSERFPGNGAVLHIDLFLGYCAGCRGILGLRRGNRSGAEGTG